MFFSLSPAASPSAPRAADPAAHAAPRSPLGSKTLRIGLVGCGAFARFSMRQYRELPNVHIAGVADIDPAAAERAAAELHTAPHPPESILGSPDIDLVYIATPPALHHRQALRALESGHHVLVEKPLATTLADAEELERVASQSSRACVANLVERYNPLERAVQRLISSHVLGDLVHGMFLNEAADEGLSPQHWFWDRGMSGGIFIEHGVHFFDLVASWLGQGRVVSAARNIRPQERAGETRAGLGGDDIGSPPVEEQVCCTCRYGSVLWHASSSPGFEIPAM